MTRATVAAGWRNYEFTTNLPCARGCSPGTHPLYIGMSSRPGLRYEQHESQPWFPFATGFVVHPEVYASEADALAAEETRIRARRPLANRRHNENNRCRLDFGLTPNARRRRVGTSRRRSNRRWPRPARRLAWGAAVWLVLAVAVFVVLPMSVPFGAAVRDAVVGSTCLMALPLLGGRRRRRRR